MFLHAPNEPACRDFLSAMQTRWMDYERLNARLVVIFPVEASALADFVLDSIPLLALADPGREVRRLYASLMAEPLVQDQDVMLFVMDENGGIYICLVGREPDPGVQDDILSWLQFIGIQCPE